MSLDQTRRHTGEIQFTRFVETVRRIGRERAIEDLGRNFSKFVQPIRHKSVQSNVPSELSSRLSERVQAD